MNDWVDYILNDASYGIIYLLVFAYFFLLYFGLAPLFLWVCRGLENLGFVHCITKGNVQSTQLKYEIRHSLLSIAIFGFSAFPVIWLVRNGHVRLLDDNALNVLIGVGALTLWNELHFFIVHRIMHVPYLMRKVHYVHHRSRIPSVYSVYSFHWLEAALLSTVPLTFVPFFPVAPLAIALYPLASILLNFAGHCNYRWGSGDGSGLFHFGTRHNAHHSRGKGNYGFALPFFDKVISKFPFLKQ